VTRMRVPSFDSSDTSTQLNLICRCRPLSSYQVANFKRGRGDHRGRPALSDSLLHSHQSPTVQSPQTFSYYRCEFFNGPAFLQDLANGSVQPCLINAMCALSARYHTPDLNHHLIDRFSTHPSLMTQPRYMAGMQFARDARRQCQLDQPVFRLYIIQTLALLALHAFSINQGSQAWFYLGTPFQSTLCDIEAPQTESPK
jgi:hypothetical protein